MDKFDSKRASRYERLLQAELEPRRELTLPTPVPIRLATERGSVWPRQRERRSTVQLRRDDEKDEEVNVVEEEQNMVEE